MKLTYLEKQITRDYSEEVRMKTMRKREKVGTILDFFSWVPKEFSIEQPEILLRKIEKDSILCEIVKNYILIPSSNISNQQATC